MTKQACPTGESYLALLEGRLSAEQVESQASHIEACPSCAGTIANLESDTLSDALRAGAKAAPHPDEPVLQKLLERSKASLVKPGEEIDGAAAESEESQIPHAVAMSEIVALLGKPESPDEIGRLGGYRVLRELGHGGMGAVFEAEDVKLERQIALKVMKPKIAKNPRHRQRFLREAKAAAKVESDFVCPIYQVGEENGVPFIAMPFLKGEPLGAHLKRGERLPIREVVRIGKEVAEGLSAAHEAGLIHRYIKPANIWLETQRAGPPRARILDFGLARSYNDAHITKSGAILGTPAFISPEQARGDKHVDARADLFSLGCVLYALCSGEQPFKGKSTIEVLMALATLDPWPLHEISSAIPKSLSDLILQMLAKQPEDRPATAKDVIEALVKIEHALLETPADTTLTNVTLKPAKSKNTNTLTPKGNAQTITQIMPRAATPSAPPRRSFGFLAIIAFGAFACILALAGGGGYYIVTDKGTIEIRTEDEKVTVSLLKNGQEIEILAGKSGQTWAIRTGDYTISLKDDPNGQYFALPEKFVLNRDGVQVVTVQRVKKTLDADKNPPKILPNTALRFGPKDYVEFSTLILGQIDEGTLEAYVFPESPGRILKAGGASVINSVADNLYALVYLPNGRMHQVNDSFSNLRTAASEAGRPIHLAVVWKDNQMTLFVEGKILATSPAPKSVANVVASALFAGAVPTEPNPGFQGIMREVRVSKVARYDPEFTPKDRFERDADTLALYHCDEGSGDVLKDSSGNNHHGKIVGAKWVSADGTPIVPAAPTGFVPLFNGKDLTGWTPREFGGLAARWKVVDGAVTCSGPHNYIFTVRDDFDNFHLRAEVMGGDEAHGGIFFRTDKHLSNLKAQISNAHTDQRTGSLYGLVKVTEPLVPADTWFTYEIIAQGKRIRLVVNGKEAADYTETRQDRATKGRITLQIIAGEIHFRKIEIKQLDPLPKKQPG